MNIKISPLDRPLVPAGYVDFLGSTDRLRDIRSGDIILMSNFTPERTLMEPEEIPGQTEWINGGYYFGTHYPGWHGSLYDTDMTILIIFSHPMSEAPELSAFLSTMSQSVPPP